MLGIEGRVTPELVAETAGLMAEAFGWTEAEKAEAVDEFRDYHGAPAQGAGRRLTEDFSCM